MSCLQELHDLDMGMACNEFTICDLHANHAQASDTHLACHHVGTDVSDTNYAISPVITNCSAKSVRGRGKSNLPEHFAATGTAVEAAAASAVGHLPVSCAVSVPADCC